MDGMDGIEAARPGTADSEGSSYVSRRQKCKQYTLKVIAFLFSNVGLVGLVTAYCVMGAFAFMALEKDAERLRKIAVQRIRVDISTQIVQQLRLASAHRDNWETLVEDKLTEFQGKLTQYMTGQGFDGNMDHTQWTFIGAMLFCITVVTTIGKSSIYISVIQFPPVYKTLFHTFCSPE